MMIEPDKPEVQPRRKSGRFRLRPAWYGAAAGTIVGLLLIAAGWASHDAVNRFVELLGIILCSAGCGMIFDYGPKRAALAMFGFDRPGTSVGECLLCALVAALRGLVFCPIAIALAGFFIGGIGRLSPGCGLAPSFIEGAIFGLGAFAVTLGIPAACAGAVTSGLIYLLLNRWNPPFPLIDLISIIVMIPLVLAYGHFFVH